MKHLRQVEGVRATYCPAEIGCKCRYCFRLFSGPCGLCLTDDNSGVRSGYL